ncbi:MAG TPA: ACP S-malonyltransferase [Desulfobacteraceae bacterium]|nr:ACP S-malonyltransferase [Desulfobacteraceae bacterium]HPJ67922.1 ACP S-malonyltransferase [Desulfobacteraceae bacterium]HPQ29115.1 ACP S-malonyltransferase [Desulfobacteraceae bacterium]
MHKKTGFLFPGQGSQFVGMGKDLASESQNIKKIFQQVDEICQRPISELCFEGPMNELTLTVNLQPAVTSVSLACLAAINESDVFPTISSGHSLGEYGALVSGGVLSTYDALRLVQKRGELMHREAVRNPGSMAAVIGMDIDSVRDIVTIAREKDTLAVANHNTAEQIVITGENAAVSRALQLVKERKGKAVPLKVSGAWHSGLMQRAVGEFRQFMEQVTFKRPESSVLFNATAEEENDPEKIKDIMAEQLVTPVRWYDIMQKMIEDGVDCFVEVGPGKVLTGLLKKILPSENQVGIYNIQDIESLRGFLKEIKV